MTFTGSKVGKFPVSLSLPLFPAHLHTQLLPPWAALVSTDIQKLHEHSCMVLWPVLGQTQKHMPFTKDCSKYSLVQQRAEVQDNKGNRERFPWMAGKVEGYLQCNFYWGNSEVESMVFDVVCFVRLLTCVGEMCNSPFTYRNGVLSSSWIAVLDQEP